MKDIQRKDWDLLDLESLEGYLDYLIDSDYIGDDIDALFDYIDNLKENSDVDVLDLQDDNN